MKKTSEQKFKFDAVLRLPALHRHSCMPKQLKRYCALITLAAVTATSAFAADYNTSNGTTDWFTDTNYAPVGVPDAATAVWILTTTDVAAKINTPGALASAVDLGLYLWPGKLVVGASGTLDVTGNLVARSATNGDQTSSLTNDGTITVGATLSSSGTSTFENNGTLDITSNIVMNAGGEASFTNDGAITLIGSLYSRGLGTFDNTSGGTLTTVNVLLGNDDAGADNTFTNTGDLDASFLIRLSDAGTGTFNMDGGSVDASQLQVATGTGTGTLNMNAGALTLTGDLTLGLTGNTGAGTFNMNGGTLRAVALLMNNATTTHLNLHGGTINLTSSLQFSGTNWATNTVDITEGVLIADSSDVGGWNYINSLGAITAYSGYGVVNIDYDVTNSGQSTMFATAPTMFDGDAAAGDPAWGTAANWNLGDTLPTSGTAVLVNAASLGYAVEVQATGAEAASVLVGVLGESGELSIAAAGGLTVTGDVVLAVEAGLSGTLSNDGDLDVVGTLTLASAGTGAFDMNGGTVTLGAMDLTAAGTGHLNLYGGTITASSVNLDGNEFHTIDITEGEFIMGGNRVGGLEWMTGLGRITAYSGAGTVVASYDSGSNTTTLSAILPVVPFPTLATYVHGPELIPNSDFANLENKSVATNVHGLWYESNSFGDLTEISAGAEANLIDWSFFYDDPSNITPLVGTPNVLDADTVAYPLDNTFLLDTWLNEDEVMLTSVSNYRNGMQSEDILDGVTIDADATYLFAVSGWTETDNTGGLATLTAALTTGGDATDTLSAVPGSLIEVPIANLTTETPLTVQLSGADLIAAQVNVMFNLVSTAVLPGVDPAGLAHDNVIIRENFRNEDYMSKVRLDSVSLSTVLVPEWGDLNRDGVVDAADESYAQSFLDGTIDGGNDAAARIAAEMALSGGTSAEALAALNLTEFDISGDGTFDAADVALVLSLSGASMASTNVVFNGSDEFEIVVDGLIPTVNYHLKRTADLSVDYTTVTTVEATSATETFTDPTPPAGKAFYKVTN